MYHNIQGEPTKSTAECWVYKNTGNAYYAKCTSVLNSTANVEGVNITPSKRLYFTSTNRIDFLAATYEDTLEFKGTMNITNVSQFSRAYITISA